VCIMGGLPSIRLKRTIKTSTAMPTRWHRVSGVRMGSHCQPRPSDNVRLLQSRFGARPQTVAMRRRRHLSRSMRKHLSVTPAGGALRRPGKHTLSSRGRTRRPSYFLPGPKCEPFWTRSGTLRYASPHYWSSFVACVFQNYVGWPLQR
jgi:hypothetical protein